MIDDFDVVIRFNLLDYYEIENCGRRFTHWFVNHRTDKQRRRKKCCQIALDSTVTAITPYGESYDGLSETIAYYKKFGIDILFPDIDLEVPGKKQGSIGYCTAQFLISVSISFTVIGFTGEVSGHHDGKYEIQNLATNPLVDLRPMNEDMLTEQSD